MTRMSTTWTLRAALDSGSAPGKRRRAPILRACCAAGLLLLGATGPAPAQNVSVSDYRVPVSRADNLRIDVLSLNYVTEGNDTKSQTGNLNVIYKKFYDSLPFAYSIDLLGATAFNKDPIDGDLNGNLTISLVNRVKKYTPAEGNLFIFEDTDMDFDESFDRPAVEMTLGVGYGRFINATPLRKAVRIEEFFLEEGIITDHLPKEDMIELGQAIEKEKEYKDLYGDRYRNYWFEDMSDIIKKSGMVLGDIGFGVLRMQEVLFQERINDRFYGWEASAGVKFQVLTPQEDLARRDPSMSIGFRYSRPISWSTQINTRFDLTTPFSGNFGREYGLGQETDFIYEFTNKVSFQAAHQFRADKARNEDAKLTTTISFALSFFIENKVSLTAFEQIKTAEDQPFRQSLSLLLNYKIF